jgi:hypothetical protein
MDHNTISCAYDNFSHLALDHIILSMRAIPKWGMIFDDLIELSETSQ